MLLGLPGAVWAVLGIEFVERLGYYAVAFSLFTYCTVMLRTGPSAANAIINATYILIPAAAFLASGVADSSVGRPRVLAGALGLYTLALFLLFFSACPGMYGNFPSDPLDISKVLFAIFLLCFSVGYGSMKVCTNPIMADCVVLHYRGSLSDMDVEGEGDDSSAADERQRDTCSAARNAAIDVVRPGAQGSLAPPAAAREDNDEEVGEFKKRGESPPALLDSSTVAEPNLKNTIASPLAYGSTHESATDAVMLTCGSPTTAFDTQLEQQALSRLFIYAYWIANVGGLVGSFVAPLLRSWESARVVVGSETHTTGYYYSFLLAAFSVSLGGVFLFYCFHWLPHNAPAPNYVLVRVLATAVANRVSVWCGKKEFATPATPPLRDWLDYACAKLRTTAASSDAAEVTVEGECSPGVDSGARLTESQPAALPASGVPFDAPLDHSIHVVTTPAWVADCRATLRVCKAFIALPVYWLLCNQFSTNLMYQAAALNLPDSVPEELFNNINTVTMLVFLAAWDQWIVPRVLQHRVPAARLRIVGGFACMWASMLWCGVLQCAITRRGYYAAEDSYVLKEGQRKLSAGWLVMPYVLQGFSSAFVDPTVMEVAYRDAPARMKGTVMGLYWVASSASGFLGLALSPIMKPQNAAMLFFVFAAAQMVVSGVFYVVNRDRAY